MLNLSIREMKLIIYFFFGFLFVQQNALGVESPILTLSKLNDQFHINDLDHLQGSTQKEFLGISHYIPIALTETTYSEHPEGYSLVIAIRIKKQPSIIEYIS